MAIVAGSLIFRPNSFVPIGYSCSRRVARPPANCDRCTPALAGCQLTSVGKGRSVLGPSLFPMIERAPQKSMPPIPPMPPPGPPGTALAHSRQCAPHGVERSRQVHRDDIVPHLLGRFGKA